MFCHDRVGSELVTSIVELHAFLILIFVLMMFMVLGGDSSDGSIFE